MSRVVTITTSIPAIFAALHGTTPCQPIRPNGSPAHRLNGMPVQRIG